MNDIKKTPVAKAVSAAPLTKTQSKLAEAASVNFWTFRNHVGKKLCTQVLHKSVQREIVDRLAENGQSTSGVRFIVDLFGPYQKKFKDFCIAPGAAIHTHSDKESMSYKDKDPTRIIYVTRSIQFATESDELINRRKEKVLEFAADYAKYCKAGKDACDQNFPFLVKHPSQPGMTKVSDLLNYPTKRQFIDAFYAYRSEFTPLSSFDVDKFAHLPAEFVRKQAAAHDAAVVRQMDHVKEQALESVKISMDLIATQLSKGERLHETLLEKAALAARHLREIADGYNNSQMLRALAKTIEDRIMKQAKAWESFKEDDKAKAAASRAAAAVSKKLGQIGKPQVTKVKAKPAAKAVTKGKSAAGGLLAKRKARKAKQAATK